MLVIGFRQEDNHTAHRSLNIDTDLDPRKAHDALKKACGGAEFSTIMLIDDSEVAATYVEGEDYDLGDAVEDELDVADDAIDIEDDDLDDEELSLDD